MAGDMDLFGVALDVGSNDSRAGWFGRGLSLEGPPTPLHTPACGPDADKGGSAQAICRSSGSLPANEGTGSIVALEGK